MRRLWHAAGSQVPPEMGAASYTCSMECLTLWDVTCKISAHAQVLCREFLVVVTYSSSGRHSSGWKSGFRKCAVLKCELFQVSGGSADDSGATDS